MGLDKLVSRRHFAQEFLISLAAVIIIPRLPWISDSSVGKMLQAHFGIELAITLVFILPLRTFLDRREAKRLMTQLRGAEIDVGDLNEDQEYILRNRKPAPGFYGSQWLERILIALMWVLFIPLALLLVLAGLAKVLIVVMKFLGH